MGIIRGGGLRGVKAGRQEGSFLGREMLIQKAKEGRDQMESFPRTALGSERVGGDKWYV